MSKVNVEAARRTFPAFNRGVPETYHHLGEALEAAGVSERDIEP